MKLVVDASVAVKWLVAEEHSDTADQLLQDDDELHAPRLMVPEIANALWRKVRAGEVERSHAPVLMAAVSRMPIRWAADETVCADALRIAVMLDRPAYDCLYLALAHRLHADLITADTRFANAVAASEHGGAVLTLQELAARQGQRS